MKLDFPDATLSVELASAILEQGYRGDPPLLATVIAATFADRLLALAESGANVPTDVAGGTIVMWVEEVCARYSLPKGVTAMLERACSIARNVLRAHPEAALSEVQLVAAEQAVGAVLALHRQKELRDAQVIAAEDIEIAMAGFLLQLDDADPASAEHSRAVGLWCKRIARRLDLDEETETFVARCGLLHDVGKTRTPQEVLQAPRGLTKEEWVLMRAHTTDGAAMIDSVPLLRPFAPAARWHHERLDGMGYPDKLSADDIPLHIRIVTVADCFNAMIGRRPYRLPMPPSAALEQLLEHQGTQFDPSVVEAMVDVVERND